MDDRIPVLFAQRRKGCIACDSGIADHSVPRAVAGNFALQHVTALLAVAHIEAEQSRASSSLFNRVQRLLRTLFIAMIMHANRKAICGKLLGDGAADAFAGAGDQYRTIHAVFP